MRQVPDAIRPLRHGNHFACGLYFAWRFGRIRLPLRRLISVAAPHMGANSPSTGSCCAHISCLDRSFSIDRTSSRSARRYTRPNPLALHGTSTRRRCEQISIHELDEMLLNRTLQLRKSDHQLIRIACWIRWHFYLSN